MAEKLRLGVIGIGFAWDRLHYPAFRELADKYEIKAVCNKTVDKAQGFAKGIGLGDENIYSDYREMIERDDLDVIDVLVPISEYFAVARDVLQAGKNLIAEKPFASTPEAAKELITLKNNKQLKVMVAENLRYDEGAGMIKDILSSGQIGEVLQFVYQKGADFEKEKTKDTFAAKEWRQHPVFYGGIFLDGGIHDIALMRFLFGDAESVCGVGRPQREEDCPYQAISSILQFQNGVIGSFSYLSQQAEFTKPPVGLRIFGTLGDIYLEDIKSGTLQIHYKDGRKEQKSFRPGRGYYHELSNFYDGNIVSTPEKELGDIQLVFDILKSIEDREVKRYVAQ